MSLSFLEAIRPELDSVDLLINKELKLKSGHASEFAHLDFNPLQRHLRPALVILTARLLNRPVCEKVISLAGIIQFIYTASLVHLGISDQDKVDKSLVAPQDGSQFPVLVGDYLFGKFFNTLCEAEMLPFLNPLAEIICQMNEGSILRKKVERNSLSAKDWFMQIVEKETAELIAGSCRLGAELSNASPAEIARSDSFGRYLGLALGLIERGVSFDKALEYLKKALKELLGFKDVPARRVLEKFVHMLMERELIIKKIMVV